MSCENTHVAPPADASPHQGAGHTHDDSLADAPQYQDLPHGKKNIVVWMMSLFVVSGLMVTPIIIDSGSPGDYPGEKIDKAIKIGNDDKEHFAGPVLGECYDKSSEAPYGTEYHCGNTTIKTMTMTGNSNGDHVFRRGIRATTFIDVKGELNTVAASAGAWKARVAFLDPQKSLFNPDAEATLSAAFTKKDDPSTYVIASVTGGTTDDIANVMGKIVASRGFKQDIAYKALNHTTASMVDAGNESGERLLAGGEA